MTPNNPHAVLLGSKPVLLTVTDTLHKVAPSSSSQSLG